MIEVLVSVALISVGILSLLTLLPSGWRLSGTSDNLGRAAGILQAELERGEIRIMNGNNSVTSNRIKNLDRNGKETTTPGQIFFTAGTVVVSAEGSWKMRVTVTWPGNSTGIAESVIVGRQMAFAQ